MRNQLTLALAAIAGTTVVLLSGAAADDSTPLDPPVEQTGVPRAVAAAAAAARAKNGDLPDFSDVGKDYEKVVSTADGKRGLYTVWKREKDGQVLAELPRNFESQTLFIAFTIAGGTTTAGVQTGDVYARWKRFDKRLALIEPNFAVRTTGDLESRKGHDRVFTDRVLLDVPIAAKGPGGGPVIDMDALLLTQATKLFGGAAAGAQIKLARIEKAKSFPENVELAFKLPLRDGRLGTLHYSISVLPGNTGYKPRKADNRIGYFTTSYRDVGHPGKDTPWVRYVNRWKLEKADPKLRMSPPKEPIVFYLEHTIPVRYRRWVRDGVLEWNKAFEGIGLVDAVEVRQQDARTGAHMEKDPEDARYNFVLWTNAGMGFAIGPSRVDPRSGQIIDADIVMDEGFISSWVRAWERLIPRTAMLNFGPETLAWLRSNPRWDPRVLLASPATRDELTRRLASASHAPFAGHPAAAVDPSLLGDDEYDGLRGRVSQVNGRCDYTMAAGLELALIRLAPELLLDLPTALSGADEDEDDQAGDDEDDEQDENDDEQDENDDEEDESNDEAEGPQPAETDQKLDGVPERFIGPLLKSIVMHEVGHTLGLRHNFKASCAYGLDEINSRGRLGLPIVGSVMEYTPININFGDGEVQGPYAMPTLGPYDHWAIEYGYTFDRNLAPILARVNEPELIFGTDEDSWGSDPRARVFDLGKNPLDYADSQMRLVRHLRGKILEDLVKEGDSWAEAREAYELLLSRHFGAVSISANWLGGAYSNRDHKGDPGDRPTVVPAPLDQQRRALQFVIDNTFDEDAFGLTPELLSRMSVDKWWDDGGFASIFDDPAWPIHDRILAIQGAALTMLFNPTTLNRVYDNEFRVPSDEEALTLPDLLWDVSDEIWSELDDTSTKRHTARQPMVTSFRRNLQREHLARLIDLMLPNPMFGAAAMPVTSLTTHKLRDIGERIDKLLARRGSRLDPYTLAHLSEASVRIGKALDAQYIYNTDDLNAGGGLPFLLFGQEDPATAR